MIIRDNVLSESGLEDLKDNLIYNKAIPWHWNDHKVTANDGTDTIVHMVYRDNTPLSDSFNKIHTYFSVPLDICTWFRIKVNCTWREQESRVFGWHRDFGPLESPEKFKAMKTAVYYCTTTDGPTVFQDSEDKVECIENRLVTFDSTRFHSGVSHIEGNTRRIVINFNYF